jgi:hypothetical protein
MIGWKRVRFNLLLPEQTTPPITPGMQVKSITMILDQGPETGVAAAGGLVVIDNININGQIDRQVARVVASSGPAGHFPVALRPRSIFEAAMRTHNERAPAHSVL